MTTGKKAAHIAGKLLGKKTTGKKEKEVDASALAQAKKKKTAKKKS